jgi:glutamyl-tRNA reductase
MPLPNRPKLERKFGDAIEALNDVIFDGLDAIQAMREIVALAKKARRSRSENAWSLVDQRIAEYERWYS